MFEAKDVSGQINDHATKKQSEVHYQQSQPRPGGIVRKNDPRDLNAQRKGAMRMLRDDVIVYQHDCACFFRHIN